ncbi:response regulator transcription factor [Wenyingzhuangia sp. IMCC45574]
MILHQGMVIQEGEEGKLAYSLLIHTDIEHITNINPRTISLFGFNGYPLFIGVDPFEDFEFKEKANLYTTRETEVLRLTGSGYSNKEVADALFLSEETIKSHKKNILAKSDCKNITEVVTRCVKNGWI